MRRYFFFIVFSIIFSTLQLFSQNSHAENTQKRDSAESVFLDTITVVAPVVVEDSRTSHVTIIKGDLIKNRFTSIPELISETVGVRVNQFGGLGDFSAISIRGSSSEQVLIYLDGFLLNSARGGGAHLGLLPSSHIDSIEVYRGSAPILLGQTGIGGMINIRTKRAGYRRLTSFQAEYGSFNTIRLNASHRQNPGRFDMMIGLDYTKSDNNFTFLNDNGTQFNASDDTVVKRKNSQFELVNLITKWGYDFSENNRVDLYHNYLKTDKGIPGLGAFQSRHAHLKTEAYRTGLELDMFHLFRPALDLKWTLQHTLKKQRFQDRLGEIGLANQDNKNTTKTYEFRLNPDLSVGKHQVFRGILQFRQEQFRPFDRFQASEVSTSRRETYSIGIEDQISLLKGRLFLSPSVLYDTISNRFKGDSLLTGIGRETPLPERKQFLTRQIGLLAKLSNQLEIRANIGRYFRLPNFFELFGDRGGTVGNPDLLAEEGLNRDIGFRYEKRLKKWLRKITVEAAYFHNRVKNLILFIQTSQRISKPQNIGRAQTIGQEFSGRIDVGKYLHLSANYTHQRSINKSEIPSQKGKFLPGRPVHEFSSKVVLSSEQRSLFYDYHFTAKNFLDRVNQRVAKARHLHNIGFSVKPGPNLSATFEIKNLGDNQVEDVFGFPLPGRAYFFTLAGTL